MTNKDLIPYLSKLIDLYGGQLKAEDRWRNRNSVRQLTQLAEDYNAELEKIRNTQNEKIKELKQEFNLIEALTKSEDGKYPPLYIERKEEIELDTIEEVSKLQNLIIELPDDFPKLKLKDVIMIARTRKIELWGIDYSKLDQFIEE